MDLRTHISVIWRWKLVVGLGLAAACLLTVLTVYSISFSHGLTHRQGQTWGATETLLLYTNYSLNEANPPPNNLTGLTSLYVEISNSATLRTKVLPEGRPTKSSGNYSAYQVSDQNNNPQPIMNFAGSGASAAIAANVARRASSEFRSYVSVQTSSVPASRRVFVKVLTPASVHNARVIKGRNLTLPIIVFLAVAIATLGVAYLLENLRPPERSTKRRRGGRRRPTAQPTRFRERKPASTLSAHAESTRQVETTRSP